MRIAWLPDALAGLAALVAIAAGARLVLRLLPDSWVIINALAQPRG